MIQIKNIFFITRQIDFNTYMEKILKEILLEKFWKKMSIKEWFPKYENVLNAIAIKMMWYWYLEKIKKTLQKRYSKYKQEFKFL